MSFFNRLGSKLSSLGSKVKEKTNAAAIVARDLYTRASRGATEYAIAGLSLLAGVPPPLVVPALEARGLPVAQVVREAGVREVRPTQREIQENIRPRFDRRVERSNRPSIRELRRERVGRGETLRLRRPREWRRERVGRGETLRLERPREWRGERVGRGEVLRLERPRITNVSNNRRVQQLIRPAIPEPRRRAPEFERNVFETRDFEEYLNEERKAGTLEIDQSIIPKPYDGSYEIPKKKSLLNRLYEAMLREENIEYKLVAEEVQEGDTVRVIGEDNLSIEDWDNYFNLLMYEYGRQNGLQSNNSRDMFEMRDFNLQQRFKLIEWYYNNGYSIPINLINSVTYNSDNAINALRYHSDLYKVVMYINIYDSAGKFERKIYRIRSVTGPTFRRLQALANNRDILVDEEDVTQSDQWDQLLYYKVYKIRFFKNSDNRLKEIATKTGMFFDKINTATNIDLSRYQIYTKKELEKKESDVHCLLHTLKTLGVSDEELSKLTDIIREDVQFNLNYMNEVCNILDKAIRVYRYDDKDGKLRDNIVYPERLFGVKEFEVSEDNENSNEFDIIKCRKEFIKNNPPLNICIYNHHIFVYELVPYTRQFMEWYVDKHEYYDKYRNMSGRELLKHSTLHKVKDEDRPRCYWKTDGVEWGPMSLCDENGNIKYKNDGTPYIYGYHQVNQLLTSLSLVKLMFENGLFIHDVVIEKQLEYVKKNVNKEATLKYMDHEQQLYWYELEEKKKKLRKHKFVIPFAADIETEVTMLDREQRIIVEEEIKESIDVEEEIRREIRNEDYHKPLIGAIKAFHTKDTGYRQYGFKRTDKYRNENGEWVTEEKEDGVLFGILEYVYKEVTSMKNGFVKSCGKEKLAGIKLTPVIYFHNSKYDLHALIRDMKGMDIKIFSKPIDNNTTIYEFKCSYKGIVISIRDSYKLFSQALSEFANSFNLGPDFKKKEFIAYKYYKRDNFGNEKIKVDDYFKLVELKPWKHRNTTYVYESPETIAYREYKEILKKYGNEFDYDEVNQTFNPWKYYYWYLYYDVKVLEEGLKAFNEETKKIWGVSIYDSLTISSLADKVVKINRGYDGVYAVMGQLRKVLSNAIVGGMCYYNKKTLGKEVGSEEDEFIAIDCNSEYPAAIVEICKQYGGIPMGKAKKYRNEEHFKELGFPGLGTKITCFYVCIRLLKVNKEQETPFICHKGDGSIDYKNEPPKFINEKGELELKPIWINHITLEDYLGFQKINYEFVEGVYWDEGVNPIIGKLTQDAYNLKLEADDKKEDGKVAALKLFLNSIYGKTILKQRLKTTRIIRNDKYKVKKVNGVQVKEGYVKNGNLNDFKARYSHIISSEQPINEEYTMFKQYCYDGAYTMPHIGGLILAMSKRILYRVLNVCNDLGALVTYIDTDSIRLYKKDLQIVNKVYESRYKRQLIGLELGQFKYDIKLKYYVQNEKGEIKEMKAKNVCIVKTIVVGKKQYLDIIRGIDHTGRPIYDHYKRLKGVTEKGLDYKCKTEYCLVNLQKNEIVTELVNQSGAEIIEDNHWGYVLCLSEMQKIFKQIPKYKGAFDIFTAFNMLGIEYVEKEDGTLVAQNVGKFLKFKQVNKGKIYRTYKDYITKGYEGDILRVYKDMCDKKEGIEIENVVPGNSTMFVFDYMVGVRNRISYKKMAKMNRDTYIIQDKRTKEDKSKIKTKDLINKLLDFELNESSPD